MFNYYQNINWVQGLEGAKAYQIYPNSSVILMDSENDNTMYIKTSDHVGISKIRTFKYEEIEETQKSIADVNINLLTQSNAIQALNNANTQKILDVLSTNRIADMQNQINQLQLQNAMCGVVRYPTQTSYCSGANPFTSGCCNV